MDLLGLEMVLRKYLTKKTPEPEPEQCSSSSRSEPQSVGQTVDSESCSSESESQIEAYHTKRKKTGNASRKDQIEQSKKRMSFNPRWVDKYHWVRHDSIIDGAFCTICEKWGKSLLHKLEELGFISHSELGERPWRKCKSMLSPIDIGRHLY